MYNNNFFFFFSNNPNRSSLFYDVLLNSALLHDLVKSSPWERVALRYRLSIKGLLKDLSCVLQDSQEGFFVCLFFNFTVHKVRFCKT